MQAEWELLGKRWAKPPDMAILKMTTRITNTEYFCNISVQIANVNVCVWVCSCACCETCVLFTTTTVLLL